MRQLVAVVFALFGALACDRAPEPGGVLVSPLEFRIGSATANACGECVRFDFEDSLGEKQTVYARARADLIVMPSEVRDIGLSRSPDGMTDGSLRLSPEARERLDFLLDELPAESQVLVSVGDLVVDAYGARLLRAANGHVFFTARDPERLELMTRSLGITAVGDPKITDEVIEAACKRAARGEASFLERCLHTAEYDSRASREELDRIEGLLRTGRKEDRDEALKALGVDPR